MKPQGIEITNKNTLVLQNTIVYTWLLNPYNINYIFYLSNDYEYENHSLSAFDKNEYIIDIKVFPKEYEIFTINFDDLLKDREGGWFKEAQIVSINKKKSLLTKDVVTFYLNRKIFHLTNFYCFETKTINKDVVLEDQTQLDFWNE